MTDTEAAVASLAASETVEKFPCQGEIFHSILRDAVTILGGHDEESVSCHDRSSGSRRRQASKRSLTLLSLCDHLQAFCLLSGLFSC